MKKDMKLSMQKKIENKKEIEKLSNKSLTVFTVALFCEVILMFLASALNGTGSYRSALDDFICVTCGAALVVFVAMLIVGSYMKKNASSELAASVFNWSFVILAVSMGSFFISAPSILPAVLGVVGQEYLGGALAVKMVRFSGTNAAYAIMILIAVYVIFVFVYNNMKAKKIKKSK